MKKILPRLIPLPGGKNPIIAGQAGGPGQGELLLAGRVRAGVLLGGVAAQVADAPGMFFRETAGYERGLSGCPTGS